MSDEKSTLEALIKDDPTSFTYEGDVTEGFEVVDRQEGDARRWSQWVRIFIKAPSGKFYEWGYDQGLTEYQENEYEDNRVREVIPKDKTVVVRTWIKVPTEEVSKPPAPTEPVTW